jgi:hypothetical protein
MIDISTEVLTPLSDVPKLRWMPRRRGRAVDVRTVERWAQAGLKGIKLEVVSVGRVLCTTEAALLRFFERLKAPNADAKALTPSQNAKAQKRADAILKRFGI